MAKVKQTFSRLKNWMDSLAGNDEEGAITFIQNSIKNVIGSSENKNLSEANTMMLRWGFFNVKNADGK